MSYRLPIMSDKENDKKDVFENRVRIAAAALYRVTDILSDNEPIKWKLRKDAIEFADSILDPDDNNYHYSLVILDRLISKIGIASVGGYISRLNFQVLEREYEHVSSVLMQEMSDMHKGQNILSDISIGHYRGHVKDIKDTIKDIKDIEVSSKKDVYESSSTSERQKRITSALVGKGWLPLGDVAALCGERASQKTIQRDLIQLMQEGAIQSKGERRWRTYALVDDYKKADQ
ncbi:MAG: hypothetical protein G01um101470_128 [Parcubacteria group bacterium Gr01-1014_70]|nr:MAG: hypothetical protein G01um101470_128 [Parcubacteria group bacterium Gr01-1014_70]